MSTVNGKSLLEVLTALRAYKKPPHTSNDGFGYFKTAEYIDRFDSAVGIANYNIEYSDFSYRQIATGQELFSVKCIITIIDDDGRAVLRRECYGGYECKYAKATGRDVNLQNASDFVCSYAFKNAAKRFGIFGLKTKGGEGAFQNESHAEMPEDVKDEKANPNSEKKSDSATFINFYSEGSFEQVRTDQGRPVYKLTAHELLSPKQCKKEKSQIIFYPNQYSKGKNAETLNKLISICSEKQTVIRIKTKVCGEDNGTTQYVFLGFATV